MADLNERDATVNERLKSFDNFIAGSKAAIESTLRANLPLSSLPSAKRLNSALEYALFPGGKRLRPALSMLASSLIGVPRAESLRLACAVEFLHSSSLIIDDLPCMDDADLRRSRRTLHLMFGEGVAMLAALALLNQSYALFAEAARSCSVPGTVESLIAEASRVVGAQGMIGGQVIDLELKAGHADASLLAERDLKTVALMRFMMTAGALACNADEEDTLALANFGESFGSAYQVCDDLLDDSTASESGHKTTGQDKRHERATALNTFGKKIARRRASELIERGSDTLISRFGWRPEVCMLIDAAHFVVDTSLRRGPSLAVPMTRTTLKTASAGD